MQKLSLIYVNEVSEQDKIKNSLIRQNQKIHSNSETGNILTESE